MVNLQATQEKPKLVHVYFCGWQSWRPFEDREDAMFNIIDRSERCGTTLGIETLRSMNIPIPDYPPYEQWKKTDVAISTGIDAYISMLNYQIFFGEKLG